MNPKKIYVKVIAEHDPNAGTKPLSLTWIDGRVYEIDRVLDVCKAPSLKAGGWGMRYTCRIMGQQRYLFEKMGAGLWRGRNSRLVGRQCRL